MIGKVKWKRLLIKKDEILENVYDTLKEALSNLEKVGKVVLSENECKSGIN